MNYDPERLRVFVELDTYELTLLVAPMTPEEVLALSEETEWVISDHE